jgi:hypothetical protein
MWVRLSTDIWVPYPHLTHGSRDTQPYPLTCGPPIPPNTWIPPTPHDMWVPHVRWVWGPPPIVKGKHVAKGAPGEARTRDLPRTSCYLVSPTTWTLHDLCGILGSASYIHVNMLLGLGFLHRSRLFYLTHGCTEWVKAQRPNANSKWIRRKYGLC